MSAIQREPPAKERQANLSVRVLSLATFLSCRPHSACFPRTLKGNQRAERKGQKKIQEKTIYLLHSELQPLQIQ